MKVLSIEQLREVAPADKQGLSDAELVIDFAQATGRDPRAVGDYLGVDTGIGSSAFGAGFDVGVNQAQGLVGGAGAAVADALGATGVRDSLNRFVAKQGAEAYLQQSPNVATRVEDIEGIGDIPGYALNQLGQQVPIMGGIMAASALTGGVGGALGTAGFRAGLGQGSIPGGLGAGYTYGVGSLYNESVEGGDPSAGAALLGGIPYAAAEALVPLSVTRLGRGLNLSSSPNRGIRALQAGAGASGTEALTELAQTEMEIAFRDDLTPEEIASRRLNAAVAGGLVGGAVGAAGGLASPAPVDMTKLREEREQQARDDAALAEQAFFDDVAEQVAAYDQQVAEQQAEARRLAEEQRVQTAQAQAQADVAMEDQLGQMAGAVNAIDVRAQLEAEIANDLGKAERSRLKTSAKGIRANLEATRRKLKEPKDGPKVPARIRKRRQEQYEARLAEQQPKIDGLTEELAAIERQLAADKRAREAKRELQLMDKTGLTPQQYRERSQARAEGLEETDLMAGDQPEIAPTEEVVVDEQVAETAPEPITQETQPSAPVEEAETSAVIEEDITEELDATEEELAEMIRTSEASAKRQVLEANKSESARESLEGNVSKVDMPDKVLAATARHLRSPLKGGYNRVYTDGQYDPEETELYADTIENIRQAYHNLLRSGSAFLNSATNLVRTDAKDISEEVGRAVERVDAREELLGQVIEDMTALENAAGGSGNLNAIMAVMKATKENKFKTEQRPADQKRMTFANSLFGSREGALPTKAAFATKADSIVSSLFAARKDGVLDVGYDISVRSRDLRKNRAGQSDTALGELSSTLNVSELEAAMINGYLPHGRATRFTKKQPASKNKGVLGLINRALDAGPATGTSRLIAKILRDVTKRRREAGVKDPKVKFDRKLDQDPIYDPNTDTIHLHQATRPEVVMHELLHAYLYAYMHANSGLDGVTPIDPKAEEIFKALQRHVKDIVELDLGALAFNSVADQAEAELVQSVLRDLWNRGTAESRVNAVLELISYGNTLRGVKLLTATMPRAPSGVASKWRNSIRGIWKAIRAALSRFIENASTDKAAPASVATDILDGTILLLQGASDTAAATKSFKVKGKQGMDRQRLSARQVAVNKADPDMQFAADEKVIGVNTKFLFDAVNAILPEGFVGKTKTDAKKFLTEVVQEAGWVERSLRLLNPTLFFGKPLKQVYQDFSTDKHTGITNAELFVSNLREHIDNDPKGRAKQIIDYMDGKVDKITGFTGAQLVQQRADQVLDIMAEYASTLPEAYKDNFTPSTRGGSRPFSEALLFVDKGSDIGSSRLGLPRLKNALGNKVPKTEVNFVDEWVYNQNKDGSFDETFDFDAEYYQVTSVTNGKTDGKHQGFVRADLASGSDLIYDDQGVEFSVNKMFPWKASPSKGGGVDFVANTTVKEVMESAKIQNKADKIGIALLNTMNTLGSYYASSRFLRGLSSMGRNADGSIDEDADQAPAVFNSVDEYNQYMERTAPEGKPHRYLDPAGVPQASADELKSGSLAGELYKTGTLVKMPDTESMKDIEKDGKGGVSIHVWGDMAGKYVPGPVYAAMRDMSRGTYVFDNSVMQNYNKLLRQFKLSKTTRNPGTHITNIASNVTIMMMHGISYSAAKEAAIILYRAARNPDSLTEQQLQILNKFETSGAMLGNFSASEVRQEHYEAIRKAMSGKDGSDSKLMNQLDKLMGVEADKIKAAGNAAKKKLMSWDNAWLELYAAEDNVFRLAAFMKRAGQLQANNNGEALSDAQWREAGDFGRFSFLNYDINAVALQYARQTVMPFASWTYAIVPVLANIAMTKPWMIANVLTTYALLDGVMAAMSGDDEEMRKQLGEQYNEKLFFGRGPHSMVRIPFMGSDEQPVYWRLGDYIPLSSTMRGMPNGTFGYKDWPGGLSPNGPLMIAAAAALDIDPFTGKKTTDDTMDSMDVTLKNVGIMYDMVAPPLASKRNAEKLLDQLTGDPTTITGKDATLSFAARAFGLRFYDPYLSDEAVYRNMDIKDLKRQFGAAIKKAQREEFRSGNPDYDELNATIVELREELRAKIAEVRNEETN